MTGHVQVILLLATELVKITQIVVLPLIVQSLKATALALAFALPGLIFALIYGCQFAVVMGILI